MTKRPVSATVRWLLVAVTCGFASAAGAQDSTPQTGAWQFLRPQFYGDRAIGEVDEAFMRLDAPGTTPDPAATPVALHFGKEAAGRIKQVRLIIDNNPSPLVATLEVGAGQPIEEIGFRVRVDRLTSVRAIAETTDGQLEMRSAWVAASGGCSAPPASGAAAGMGALGDVRFHASEDGRALQVGIRHPNHSGFQIEPRTGEPIPPHYVSHMRLMAGGKLLLDVESGISISENPTLRIVSAEPIATPVTLAAEDSKAEHFSATWNGESAPRAVADAGGAH